MLRSLAQIGFGFVLGAIVMLLTLPAFGEPIVADGQILQRSDGFLYLVRNGARHWIQPAPLSDDDINAIPETEPYMTGLAPIGLGAVAGVVLHSQKLDVTFRGSKRPYVSTNPYSVPDDGNEFMTVTVAVRNTTADVVSISGYLFKLQLANGVVLDPESVVRQDDLKSMDLLPGQVVVGTVAFEPPLKMPAMALIFTGTEYDEPPIMFPLS